MDKEFFISIITVSYNSGKTIERTIKSVLNQDFKDYEYIIQDGGSTDNTREVLDIYKSKFQGRLKFYFEADEGIYDAMNKGIKKARGKYIWLVNADDYLSDNALQDIYDYCNNLDKEECVISGRMNIIDAESGRFKSVSTQGSYEKYRNNCKHLKMGICHPATIVHRDIYEHIGLYDERYYISADIDFCLRTYFAKVPIKFTPLVLTNMTDGGISNKFPIRKNMHDCNLRLSKFCTSSSYRVRFTVWFFFRLLYLKGFGYRN